jgi:hypothetical protein
MNPAMMALVFLSLLSSGPQSSTGSIRGTVTSKSTGERIAHAEVSLYPPTFTTYTDSNGVYRLSKVLPGEYSLTVSAPGYTRLTFKGLIVPLFTHFDLDARLSDGTTSSDSVIALKFTMSTLERPTPHDKMRFYKPDSTIDYKIRIVNPETRQRGQHSFTIPDSILKHK